MHRATLRAGLVAPLIGVALLAACQTTGEAPAEAQPARPQTAAALPAPAPAPATDSAQTAVAAGKSSTGGWTG